MLLTDIKAKNPKTTRSLLKATLRLRAVWFNSRCAVNSHNCHGYDEPDGPVYTEF
jgi:hypothetical protein